MKINYKVAIAGLTVLVMVWAGNILYYNNHVLKEPVFLKHYYDIVKGMSSFQLYYIDDINSNTSVVRIAFPEVGSETPYVTDNLVNNAERYYKLKAINVTMYNGGIENIPRQYTNKVITRAEVYLSDGRVLKVGLGKIFLYNSGAGQRVLHFVNSMGSSDSSGYTTMSADKDIRISGIYCRFPEIVGDAMNIYINHKPLKDVKFPFLVEMGNNFQVGYSYVFKKDDIRRTYEYNFPLYIVTQEAKSIGSYDACYTNHFFQSIQDLDIKQLEKEQGR